VSGINTPFQGVYDHSNTIKENQIGLMHFPLAVQAIINHAGLEPAYHSIASGR